MRTAMGWILAFVMVMAAAPAYSGEAVHMYRCEQNEETTEEQVMAVAQEWLAAARKSKGGEELEVRVLFPIAVNATSEMDFMFIVSAPSFQQWGVFWDNFHDSPVSEVDQGSNSKVVCPDSVLWEVERVEVKSE
jgi:hypothetical protein